MEDKHAQAKLGLVVFIALGILIFTMLWGKSVGIAQNYYRMNVFFEDVTGLEKGARVLVNGIPKGKVVNLSLRKKGVIAEIALTKDVELCSDAYAYLESPDLMAERVIAINPGNSPTPFPQDKYIPGQKSFSYNRMFSSVDDIGEKLIAALVEIQSTAATLNSLMSDSLFLKNLNNSMSNLSDATSSLKEVIETSQPKIDSALININLAGSQIVDLVNRHSPNIDTLFINLACLSTELHNMADVAGVLSQTLKNDRSTVGKLIHQDDLYVEIQRVTANLDSLISEIRRKGIKTHITLF